MSEYQSNEIINPIICPRCSTVNSAGAMNCRKCRINLNFALENPDETKGITLPSPEPKVVREFSPSMFKYFMWMVGVLTVMALIIMALDYISHGYVSAAWVSGLVPASFLLALQTLVTFRNYKVVIMEDSVSGPSFAAKGIVNFKFEHIDRNKMKRRSFLERLEGSKSVYSVDGKRIILSGLVYNQDQIQAILDSLGYEEVE